MPLNASRVDDPLDESAVLPRDAPLAWAVRTPAEIEAALEALVAEHYASLCDFVYLFVKSRDAAEDIVQEVFVNLWERGVERQPRDPRPYLYQSARNRAISYLRHRRVRERWQERVLAEEEPPEATTIAELECEDLAHAAARAVESLPERCQLIYRMSRDHGLTYAEIARTLGLSVKTVEAQMLRAFKLLRARVAPYLGFAIVATNVTGIAYFFAG
jgi:RNA polymerase sigma-70 factor (ECF subfamily)